MQDPFYVVKEEVLQSLQGVTTLYDRWKELLETTNTSSNEEFKWTANELKSGLRSIEWDITDLEETVGIVENNQAKFKIDNHELQTRKDFIQSTKSKIQLIKEDLQSTRTRGKMENDQKNTLVSSKRTSDKFSRLQNELEKDNTDFIGAQTQRQEFIIKEQDEHLDTLSMTVGRLKDMGSTIGNTIQETTGLVEELNVEVDKTDSGIRGAVNKVNKLLESTKDSTQWCIIIFLVLVLVGLIVVIFYI